MKEAKDQALLGCLLRVDWKSLTHAYGHAQDVPAMLCGMLARDADERAKSWDNFWGAVNHQGDFYDSTVACIRASPGG